MSKCQNRGIDLRKQVALVVGGSGVLGQAISLRLASFGADIVMTYFSNKKATLSISKKISKIGSRVLIIQVDVNAFIEIKKMISAVVNKFGRVDILVNAFGVAPPPDPVIDLEEKAWEQTIDINLTGAFFCCKAIAPIMVKQKSGRIINISSIFGLKSPASRGAYGASKHGLIGLTQTLAKELGSYNITVNAVCPGPIETPLVHRVWTDAAKKIGITFKDYYRKKIADIPLGRLATPNEVADLVAFLSSDMAKYISGSIIDITGAAT